MKDFFCFLNTPPRKGHFEIFELVNDSTLVWKISPKVKKELMACVEWATTSSRASFSIKCAIEFLILMQL